MDVAIVGSGGREHALGWKIAQSPNAGKLYFLPGNGGTHSLGTNIPIRASDIDGIVAFAKEKKIELVVVGPDDALAAGLVDELQRHGIRAFGPMAAAASIESSKAATKYRMRDWGIPTAGFRIFDGYDEALVYLREHGAPVVLKADGLALGKGVYVCKTMEEAEASLRTLMRTDLHGDAGKIVVIEDCLEGEEFSAHFLSDGIAAHLFPFLQDH
ncbi:MAG: phosphoribosylamine--glycine ligase, partial [Minisyncoccia bacterium]